MANETVTITTAQPYESVIQQVQDSLSQVGQTTITKNLGRSKGSINLTPKGKYSGYLSAAQAIEGTVLKTQEGHYDVSITYSVKPTMTCWIVGVGGVLLWGATLWLLLFPFYFAKKALRNEIRQALQQAQQELALPNG